MAQLNTLVAPLFERPLAYDADGPFLGVPFAIKDIGLHAKDVPQRMGSRLTGPGLVFPYDTDLMTRFRAAGMATLGITSTPELGFNFSTESVANGPTRNPWDPTRTPGGSSGGSAALLAARAVPVAHANDGAGSIRCPAAWCDLVGLKPSRGRTPVGPDQADPILGSGIEFVVTRTVRDCAALLDAVAGPGVGERYVLPAPALPYREEARRDPGRLNLAVTTTPWHDVVVDTAHVDTVHAVVRHLASLGHDVTEARPDLDVRAFDDASVNVWAAVEASWALGVAAACNAAPNRETLEATILACVEHARSVSALDLLAATLPEPLLELHPDDARDRGVRDGDRVRVWNERGAVTYRARLTDRPMPGSVAAPFGSWMRDAANVNALTSDRLGDIGNGPTFCDTLVQVTAHRDPA